MNIIRTKVVELESTPVVAYKIKLKTGGSGLKLHRIDQNAAIFVEVDKRTGDVIIDGRVDQDLFPYTAFDEAADLLAGLPYSARGKVKILVSDDVDEEEVCCDSQAGQDLPSAAQMVESPEFKAIVDRFGDENGKINYALIISNLCNLPKPAR